MRRVLVLALAGALLATPLLATPLLATPLLATPVGAAAAADEPETPPNTDGGITGDTLTSEVDVPPDGEGGGQSPGTGGTTTTSTGNDTERVISPCGMRYWMTGPEMAVHAPPLIGFIGPLAPARPPANWADHATATTGAWYYPGCDFTGGTPDRLDEQAQRFYATNDVAFFPGAPPVVQVPVEDLVEIVRDRRRIPAPTVSTNPVAETVVALRTWVWPTGGQPAPVTSRAESQDGSNWAQVTAVPGRLSLSAPDAAVGDCARAPAWRPGAADSETDCFVEFRSSSARTGTSPITATLTWVVTLTTSDGRNEVLDAGYTSSTTTDVVVAEVQSVVR